MYDKDITRGPTLIVRSRPTTSQQSLAGTVASVKQNEDKHTTLITDDLKELSILPGALPKSHNIADETPVLKDSEAFYSVVANIPSAKAPPDI